ncbi:hypothetical protein ABZP36_007445 [Zizania latifolia]
MCSCRSGVVGGAPSRLGADFVRVAVLGSTATGGVLAAVPDAGTPRRAAAAAVAISVAYRLSRRHWGSRRR